MRFPYKNGESTPSYGLDIAKFPLITPSTTLRGSSESLGIPNRDHTYLDKNMTMAR